MHGPSVHSRFARVSGCSLHPWRSVEGCLALPLERPRLEYELFRLLRWGNGRGPVDPSGSASAPRASPGLSQSSDSHLPKGGGSSLVVIRPVCRGLERGGALGVSNSGKCRGPCASDARLCPVWRSRSFVFHVCYSRATRVTLVIGARIQGCTTRKESADSKADSLSAARGGTAFRESGI